MVFTDCNFRDISAFRYIGFSIEEQISQYTSDCIKQSLLQAVSQCCIAELLKGPMKWKTTTIILITKKRPRWKDSGGRYQNRL